MRAVRAIELYNLYNHRAVHFRHNTYNMYAIVTSYNHVTISTSAHTIDGPARVAVVGWAVGRKRPNKTFQNHLYSTN